MTDSKGEHRASTIGDRLREFVRGESGVASIPGNAVQADRESKEGVIPDQPKTQLVDLSRQVLARDAEVLSRADLLQRKLRTEKRNPNPDEQTLLQTAGNVRKVHRLKIVRSEETDRQAIDGRRERATEKRRKSVYFAQWRRVKQPGTQGLRELRLSAIDPAQFPDLNRPMEVVVPEEVGAGDILAVPLPGRERGIAYYPVTRMPNPSEEKEPSQPTVELPPPIFKKEHRRKYEIQQAIRAIEQEGKSPVVTAEMLANGILVSRALDPEEVVLLKQGKVVDRDSGEIRTLPADRMPRIIVAELPEDLQRLIADEATRVQVRELRRPPTPGTVA